MTSRDCQATLHMPCRPGTYRLRFFGAAATFASFGFTASIFGGAEGDPTIWANAARVSSVSGNDHCFRSGFHRFRATFRATFRAPFAPLSRRAAHKTKKHPPRQRAHARVNSRCLDVLREYKQFGARSSPPHAGKPNANPLVRRPSDSSLAGKM
jgi:hypothetical protein